MKKIKYPVKISEDDLIDFTELKIKERKLTSVYQNREEVTLYCTCKPIPMCPVKMYADGRIGDAKQDVPHLLECARCGTYYLDRKMDKNFNLDKPEISMDINKYFGAEEKTPKKIDSNTHSKPSEYKISYEFYETIYYGRNILFGLYNKYFNERGKTKNCLRLIGNLYYKLNEIEFNDEKNNIVNLKLEHNCGLYISHFVGNSKDYCVVLYETSRGRKNLVIDKKVLDKSLNAYKAMFQRKLSPDDKVLMICNEYKAIKRKHIYFFPVSDNGLACDSFLEQRIYNWLETEMGYRFKNEYVFTKNYMNSAYEEDIRKKEWLDDGEISSPDKKKKIIIEIFGMMSKKSYALRAEEKKEFFRSRKDRYYLLDIYPEDDWETLKIKLNNAILWLRLHE